MPTTCPQLNTTTLKNFALHENSWQFSPTPFVLSESQIQELNLLGEALWGFAQALDTLYSESAKGRQPGWIADLLDQGKPEALVQYARMKRFKQHLPMVIRPDLLITDASGSSDGWQLTEIDAVPGGIGFTSALNDLYTRSGFELLQAEPTMPQAFLDMLKALTPDIKTPSIAIVVSDEAEDYRRELTWLADHLKASYPDIAVIHPKQIELVKDRLVYEDESGQFKPIDIIYRFFELFDLANIPKMELIQYAIKKKLVVCTPPFKPHLEEKMAMALFHHPVLIPYWQQTLDSTHYDLLSRVIPPTWVADPSPLPPQAIIPGLQLKGQALQAFSQLANCSQKERELVLKPSGFSPLGWGSRGVTIGHDHSQEEWQERLNTALESFPKTPYILQTFQNTSVLPMQRLNTTTGESEPFKARVRLCPYYFVQNGKPRLSGILATACPSNKKIIHGMTDAILAPVSIGINDGQDGSRGV